MVSLNQASLWPQGPWKGLVSSWEDRGTDGGFSAPNQERSHCLCCCFEKQVWFPLWHSPALSVPDMGGPRGGARVPPRLSITMLSTLWSCGCPSVLKCPQKFGAAGSRSGRPLLWVWEHRRKAFTSLTLEGSFEGLYLGSQTIPGATGPE